MTAAGRAPSSWAITRATYTRRVYRPALVLLWVLILIAVASLILGFLLVTVFFLIPSMAGNIALSRRVQRDLRRESSA
jgi:hypothetical protein